jgi:hypothetical protein
MKRFFHLTTFAFLFLATASQAQSFPGLYLFFAPTDFKRPPASLVERVEPKPTPASLARGASFAISTFSKEVVAEFAKAWHLAANGVAPTEAVVLILRMVDGSFSARSQGFTNEYKRFTFPWHPATVAIIHSHPNGSDPQPQFDDMRLADKLQVPIFTITTRGMFVYDPFTRKTSKVQDGLDWLSLSKWEKEIALK